MIVCNTRNMLSPLTGVQRYTSEVISRLNCGEIDCVSPQKDLGALRSHFWEQYILPTQLHNRLLWSPSNTGPISVEKQVVTIHDISPLDHPEWTSLKFSRWYNFIIPKLLKKCRKIITMSEFSRKRILHYYPHAENKISVIPLASSEFFFPCSGPEITETLKILSIPSKRYFIAVGSLEPRKNLKTLIKAWESIHLKLSKDIILILAGGKGKEDIFGIQKIDQPSKGIFITGHISDFHLRALYSGAIAKIYISSYEGFGLPPLEAMACGAPVICSNTTSLPEVVGDDALSVSPFSIEDISQAIIRLSEDLDLQRVYRQRGIRRAKGFTWDRTAALTLHQLREADY